MQSSPAAALVGGVAGVGVGDKVGGFSAVGVGDASTGSAVGVPVASTFGGAAGCVAVGAAVLVGTLRVGVAVLVLVCGAGGVAVVRAESVSATIVPTSGSGVPAVDVGVKLFPPHPASPTKKIVNNKGKNRRFIKLSLNRSITDIIDLIIKKSMLIPILPV